MFENGYPYTDLHELNLDWIIRKMKDLEIAMETFKATESLKFADPIIWNITTQYEKSTVVLDPSGNAYLSLQPVPAGVQLNNNEYWLEIFNFTDYTRTANQNLTVHVETNTTRATANYSVDDWLIWNDILYRVTSAIAIDDAFIVAPEAGANIEHFTVEDFIKAWMVASTALINQYKNEIDASELAFTTNLQQQFDQVLAGATVDSEVINARVGIYGKVYTTLKNAITGQIADTLSAFKDGYMDVMASIGLMDSWSINGVTGTNNGNNTMTIVGTATATASPNFYVDALKLPIGLEPGRKYKLDYNSTNVKFDLYSIDANANLTQVVYGALAPTEFTMPSNSVGTQIRLRVSNGVTVNETITTPKILRGIDGDDLEIMCNGVVVANNTDIDTLTDTGIYLLTGGTYPNSPITSNTGFIIVSHIGNSVLQIAYDFNMKNSYRRRSNWNIFNAWYHCEALENSLNSQLFTGITVANNTDIDTLTDTGIYLLTGGTYPNSPIFSNTGFILVTNIGNSTLQLAYDFNMRHSWRRRALSGTFGDWYEEMASTTYKYNVGMFGDSITYGTNGDGGGQVARPIPSIINHSSKSLLVANKGVGSMGWLSHVNLNTNAWEYIQTQDLSGYDVVTYSYGVNDYDTPLGTYLDTTPTTIMGTIYSIFNYVNTNYPGMIQILIGIRLSCQHTEIGFPEWDWYRTRIGGWSDESFDAECKKFADYYHIPYISNKQSSINAWNVTEYEPDGIHYNQEGYDIIGRNLASELERILGI